MTSPERFCLDADVLIRAKNHEYGFDILPQFWALLEEKIGEGIVYSTWRVYEEWANGKDELAAWVKRFKDGGLCTQPNEAAQALYGVIVEHVQANYAPHKAAEFLAGGDPWLIAQAWEDQSQIVTMEKAKDPRAKKPKIPYICDQLCGSSVECINTYDMVRRLGGLGS